MPDGVLFPYRPIVLPKIAPRPFWKQLPRRWRPIAPHNSPVRTPETPLALPDLGDLIRRPLELALLQMS